MIAEKIAINVSLYPLINDMANILHNYDLRDAVETLHKGGLILYPTDTIWSIGCDATNGNATAAVAELKQKNDHQPFVILVDSIEMLKRYVIRLHPRLETLLVYHKRPLTIVYDGAINLPSNVVAKDGSVAIRIPQDGLCRQLIREFGRPIVASSAKVVHQPLPTHFGEISSQIIQNVDYIVKYKQKDKTLSNRSVLVKLSNSLKEELIFLRE